MLKITKFILCHSSFLFLLNIDRHFIIYFILTARDSRIKNVTMGICRNVREQKSMVCEVAFGLLECVIRITHECVIRFAHISNVPLNMELTKRMYTLCQSICLSKLCLHRNSVKENYIRISKLLKVSFSF